MKTRWHLRVLWSVLSLGLLSCAADTDESPFTGRKRALKLGAPKSEPIELSTTGDRNPHRWSHGPRSPVTPRAVRPGGPRAFAPLPDVSVTCSASDFAVRVKPAFYGLGAETGELTLGNGCKSNGALQPYGDLLFAYPLTACDAVRQSPRGYLVYKFVLHYEPSPKRFPSRAQRVDVNIECRYPRNHHVHQLTVKPTWEPVVARKRLKGSLSDFQIELMDDSWSTPAKSQVYQLGEDVRFQVSVPHLPTGGKLYINSCYATPSTGSTSSLKYNFIDKFGCLLDSKRDPGAARFISRTDKTVRFSLKAFQFTSEPDKEVKIHCKLFVTSEDPGPARKSCTYRGNRWRALTGDDAICECCDSQCVAVKSQRAMKTGSVSGGSMLVSDQPYTAEDGFLPISPSVRMSREGEDTIMHYSDKRRSHENMWGSADVIMYDDEEQGYTGGEEDEEEEEEQEKDDEDGSRIFLGEMTGPDLEELGSWERIVVEERNKSGLKDPILFQEEGSGYVVGEGHSESAEEGEFVGDDQILDVQQVIDLNEREGELLERRIPSDSTSEPLISRGEEEDSGYEEDERTIASEVKWERDDDDYIDDGEMAWYITWR